MPVVKKNESHLRILIVDDHMMIRDGLKVMISNFKKSLPSVVDEAESGDDALKKIQRKEFDLIIIDYQMPGKTGAEATAAMLRFLPKLKILALSNYSEMACVQDMRDAGAHGYVLKNIDPYQLLVAIKTIMSGNSYYSNEVAVKLIDAEQEKMSTQHSDLNKLTRREKEILKLIAEELTNDQIGQQLSIGKRTVETHRKNLINKLNVKNTAGLVNAAYRMKLV